MSFTNQMLGALGTATSALAVGKHIQNQKKEIEFKNAEAKEGLINTADDATALGEEYLTKEEANTVKNEDGTIKPDEALDLMGNKVKDSLNNGSIELQKGQEALARMKQLRAARAKFKFILGDKNAFDYQNTPGNKETR